MEIIIKKRNAGSGSAAINFLEALHELNVLGELKKYDYISFCDQDDIWLNKKLSKAISVLKNGFDLYGSNLIMYKNEKNSVILQEIYDFNFKQLELSIREIGYGDQSINKKMKDYINLFHSIISEIHFWDECTKIDKKKKISLFLENIEKNEYLVEYFDDFRDDLRKKNLNYFIKGVNNS
mgnify:CR=1 FL=1